MYKNFKAKLNGKEKISEILSNFRFDLIDPHEMEFKSGQFISIEIPLKGLRSYSISSSEHDKSQIALTINTNDKSLGGEGVEYMNHLSVGDEVNFRGPFGIFTLRDSKALDFDGEIIWAATGSGISPIKSMIETFNINSQNKNVLYFGIRNINEITFKSFFENLKINHPSFDYHYSLSNEKDWEGKHGYITDHIISDAESIDKNKIKVFICGKTTTVQHIFKNLIDAGFLAQNLHFENFG